ncbi:MAG: hypothetical protein FJ267_08325, partial [Planctomycetes bacterium]|nr:hypothetical protein [Planctomycetota bacterium]
TVDAVSQVIRISPEQIQPAPEIVRSEGAKYIAGFAKLDARLIILLEIDELLDPSKMDQVKQIASRGGTISIENENTVPRINTIDLNCN